MADNRRYRNCDLKILYGKAAGRCAFPNCRKQLILNGVHSENSRQIGEIAHIVAHSASGPRADASFPKEMLDTYANLILLCPTCHAIVDSQPEKFPAEVLLTIKQDHERWVCDQLDEGLSYVSFAELEIAAKALSSGKFSKTTDFV